MKNKTLMFHIKTPEGLEKDIRYLSAESCFADMATYSGPHSGCKPLTPSDVSSRDKLRLQMGVWQKYTGIRAVIEAN